MSARGVTSPKGLVVAVLVLSLGVLGLGGAVLAVKLRPEPTPTSATQRELAQWRDAVDAEPDSDIARTGLGLALLGAGRKEDARAEFQEALHLNEQNWMAAFQLGVLTAEGNPERAIELLAQAARYAPRTSKVAPLVAEGDLLMKVKDFERAKRVYQRAIADSPFIFEGHVGLARALEELGDIEAALDEYREAARFDPGNEETAKAIERLESEA